MADYKMTYFNMNGRAEPSRMMFKLGGVEFEDIRINPPQWPAMKPTTPLGFLPILETPEGKITQATAVHMYVAGKTGFLPEDLYTQMQTSSLLITMNEWSTEISSSVLTSEVYKRAPSPEDIEERKTAAKAKLDKLLSFTESVATKNVKFIFGDKMTAVDFCLYATMQSFFVVWPEDSFTSEWFKNFMSNMKADEPLTKYLAERPASKLGL